MAMHLIYSEVESTRIQKHYFKKGYTWLDDNGNEVRYFTSGFIPMYYLPVPILLNADKYKTLLFIRLKEEDLKEPHIIKLLRDMKLKRILNEKRDI